MVTGSKGSKSETFLEFLLKEHLWMIFSTAGIPGTVCFKAHRTHMTHSGPTQQPLPKPGKVFSFFWSPNIGVLTSDLVGVRLLSGRFGVRLLVTANPGIKG